jgi:hypothetical protein
MKHSSLFYLLLATLGVVIFKTHPTTHGTKVPAKIKALVEAIQTQRIENVRKVLRRGVDVNFITPRHGITPLHIAVEAGSVDIVQELLNQKALVDVQRRIDGATPLYLACHQAYFNEAIIRTLIEAGADPLVQSSEAQTPLKISLLGENSNIADMLLDEALRRMQLILETPLNSPEKHLLVCGHLMKYALSWCFNCMEKDKEAELQCSRCGCVFYCSQECQAIDWKKKHKMVCKKLSQLPVDERLKSSFK